MERVCWLFNFKSDRPVSVVGDKNMRFLKSMLIFAFLVFSRNNIFAAALADPIIPDGEKVTYISRSGSYSLSIDETVSIKQYLGRQIYEIATNSDIENKVLRFEKETMEVISADIINKFLEGTTASSLIVVHKKPNTKKNEIVLSDFSVLQYILRGFPFGKTKSIKIRTFRRHKNKGYVMNAKMVKKEKIKIWNITYECYKIEFTLEGFWSGVIPKTYFWYTVKPPHYLVKYEGSDGPPGSPLRTVELQEYSAQ